MDDKHQPAPVLAVVKPYAGWAALGFLIVALFSSIIARNFAIPLGFYAFALCFALFRYWDEVKAFDFWALDEWLSARREAWGITEWQAPHRAAEMYCNQVAIRTRNEAAAEMNTIMMETIRQTSDRHSGPIDFSRPASDANAERNARYDAAQVRLNQTNALLSRELHHYLTQGLLLAKGLPTSDDLAKPERLIPTSRWRVLTLDIAKAQATGMGWKYSGIVVAAKPKKPEAKAAPADKAPEPAPRAPAPVAKAPPPASRPAPPRPSKP